MNTTDDASLLQLPTTSLEKLLLIIYIFTSSCLFLNQFLRKNSPIRRLFPEFCLFMSFVPLCQLFHLSFLLCGNLILGDQLETAFPRVVPFLFTTYPMLFVPPVPFAITMTYSILLWFKEDRIRWFLNFKVTRCKITIFVVSLFCMVFNLRLREQEKRFIVTLSLANNLNIDIDLLKYLPILVTTVFVFAKIIRTRRIKRIGKMSSLGHAHLVHILLFLFVFWSVALTHLFVSICRYRHNESPHRGRFLGIQDLCIMQYVFVYSSHMLKWEPFKRSVCVPNVFQVTNRQLSA